MTLRREGGRSSRGGDELPAHDADGDADRVDHLPHAGEGGHLGEEDATIIAPIVEEFAAAGENVRGPVPADSAFTAASGPKDGVLAMYHDQGLIPLKTLAFASAVNVTLGLPIVRTSVDHGTAFDIAGQGKANPESLFAAIRLAAELAPPRRG